MNTTLSVVALFILATCGDVETGRLLGLGTFPPPNGLYTVSLETGKAAHIHTFEEDFSDGALTVSPDGTLYGAFSFGLDSLVIIDATMGDVTVVGPFGFPDVAGLAFGPDGTLYGFDGLLSLLLEVTTETGEATEIGYVGFVGGGGLAFTPDGTLYLAGYADGLARLYTIDLATGAGTEVGTFGGSFDIPLALDIIGEVLYAVVHEDESDYQWLVTVDRDTGFATKIGIVDPIKSLPSIGGVAFLPGPGDADRDGDVDYDDFLFFGECFGDLDEPGKSPYCAFLDSDNDGDIDCDDWEAFIPNWTEDTDPPTYPTCDGCEGDANGDGTVDPLDAGWVLARFGCPVGTGDPDCDAADQNADGSVDPLDVGYVLSRFGDCP